MTLEQLVQGYLQTLPTRHLVPATLRGYQHAATHLLRALDGRIQAKSLNSSHLGAYIKYLHSHGFAGTVRYQHLRATRLFLRWAFQQGHLTKDITALLHIPPCPRPAVWVPSPEQVQRLLEIPDRTRTGPRNRFLLELLYGTGLRLHEMAALQLTDIEPGETGVWVRQGKGHKDRLQPLGPNLQKALRNYLDQVRPRMRPGPQEEALFLTETGQPLKMRSLDPILRKYAQLLGLPELTFHSVRRAFATHMLARGAPLGEVQRLLGHESPETTVRYTQIYVEDVQRTFRQTHPRARRKKTRATRI